MYKNQPSLEDRKKEIKESLIKQYKEKAHNMAMHGSYNAPEIKVPTSHKTLKCPSCGSTNVKRISDLNRTVSVATLGLASSKIGKQYECNRCKHKW